MSNQLLHILAFWSAWFISSHGCVTVHAGLRERLLELLNAMPSSIHGVDELRKQAALLVEAETLDTGHPFNQAMFVFMIEHEREIHDEFRTNLQNIKHFFSKAIASDPDC